MRPTLEKGLQTQFPCVFDIPMEIIPARKGAICKFPLENEGTDSSWGRQNCIDLVNFCFPSTYQIYINCYWVTQLTLLPESITHVTSFMMRAGESIQEIQFEDLLCARHCQRVGESKMNNILIWEPKLQGRDAHRPPSVMEMCCMSNKNMNVQELPYHTYSQQSPEFLNGTHNRHCGEALHATPSRGAPWNSALSRSWTVTAIIVLGYAL